MVANSQQSGSDSAASFPASILEGAKQGRPEAWERLVLLCSPVVARWCRRERLSGDDLDDVVQEVFRAVARVLVDFHRDKQGDSFYGWLFTITRSKILDHRRRAFRQPAAVGGTDAHLQIEQIPANSFEVDTIVQESASPVLIIRSCLDLISCEFEPTTWKAFWQTTTGDRQPADVAAELNITVNAVYKAKSRVLKRLREELDGLLS